MHRRTAIVAIFDVLLYICADKTKRLVCLDLLRSRLYKRAFKRAIKRIRLYKRGLTGINMINLPSFFPAILL